MNNRGQIASIVLGVVGMIVLFILLMTFRFVNIKPTEVGVEIDKVGGRVLDKPLGVGYHFFNGFVTDVVVYRVAARSFPSDTAANERSREYTLDLKTNDGQNMNLDLTIIYALKSNEVPVLHQQIGVNYEDQILLPQIRSEARLAVGGYSAEAIYQGKVRDEIQNMIRTKLQGAVEKYPAIQIQDALMRHYSFSPAFEKAIEDKKLAAQQVEINKNLALAQEENAKQVEAKARGTKLQAIQEAEGRGASLEAEAKGNAAAIRVNADAKRYQLEQEAAGKLAMYKAEAEGKRLSAEALAGEGGKNVVALTFAQNIPDKLQIWGIPTGANSTSLLDLNGLFGKMLDKKE